MSEPLVRRQVKSGQQHKILQAGISRIAPYKDKAKISKKSMFSGMTNSCQNSCSFSIDFLLGSTLAWRQREPSAEAIEQKTSKSEKHPYITNRHNSNHLIVSRRVFRTLAVTARLVQQRKHLSMLRGKISVASTMWYSRNPAAALQKTWSKS